MEAPEADVSVRGIDGNGNVTANGNDEVTANGKFTGTREGEVTGTREGEVTGNREVTVDPAAVATPVSLDGPAVTATDVVIVVNTAVLAVVEVFVASSETGHTVAGGDGIGIGVAEVGATCASVQEAAAAPVATTGERDESEGDVICLGLVLALGLASALVLALSLVSVLALVLASSLPSLLSAA